MDKPWDDLREPTSYRPMRDGKFSLGNQYVGVEIELVGRITGGTGLRFGPDEPGDRCCTVNAKIAEQLAAFFADLAEDLRRG